MEKQCTHPHDACHADRSVRRVLAKYVIECVEDGVEEAELPVEKTLQDAQREGEDLEDPVHDALLPTTTLSL
jgi:hypothetical protein